MSRLGSTVLALALAGVITLAAHADEVLVAAAVVLVQLLVAVSPPLLTSSGEPIGSPRLVPAVVAGVVATVLTLEPRLLDGADGTSAEVVGATDTGVFAGVLPAVMAAVFVALVAQMLRKDGRANLVSSTGYAVTLAVVAAFAAGWLGAAQSLGGADVVAVGAAGLGGALLVWTIPVDRWICLGPATLAGAGAGAAVAATADSSMTWFFGVVVGAGAGVVAVLGQVVGRTMAARSVHPAVRWGFPGAMSVAFAAPVVYLGGQLVTAPLLR
ncbi:hypothetical protein IFT73_07800 [Aeromicrobium sp. CFBP 8757]|uniref:hypothetical protein n=1 Tax=Aeromicrobium sp. CFBP 8757 TaxID=2775288 RepID=UPI0017865369|nr:hypothetical protein [Aeromicrobium sp. CFBP 8757]MBD8606756.1 hypothetical protein [Aeromicrobium sp. CFBP 8757]